MITVAKRLLYRNSCGRSVRLLCTQESIIQSDSQRMICPSRLQEKVAIVTGSTEGIGLSIAERFCQEGAKVIICSRKHKNVKRVAEKLQSKGYAIEGIACDVTKDEDRQNLIEQSLEKYGGVDIFVSNVGSSTCFGSILNVDLKDWQETFDVNVRSPLLLTQLLAPHMKKKQSPCSILYMSSITGYLPELYFPAYSVSKTTILALTKAMAEDLASTNIRVNCLAPGIINTKMTMKGFPEVKMEDIDSLSPNEKIIANLQEIKRRYKSNVPIGRLGEPYEVAGAAAFLCSDDASYITGETLAINGGFQIRI